jgi:hypothetical protein
MYVRQIEVELESSLTFGAWYGLAWIDCRFELPVTVPSARKGVKVKVKSMDDRRFLVLCAFRLTLFRYVIG